MIRGTLRFFIISVLASWLIMSVMEWRSWNKSQPFLVDKKIEVFSIDSEGHRRINASSWPVYAATTRFIQANEDQREELAQEFYEERIQPMEKYYFLGHDGKNVRAWMLRTAALDLKVAPRESFIRANAEGNSWDTHSSI